MDIWGISGLIFFFFVCMIVSGVGYGFVYVVFFGLSIIVFVFGLVMYYIFSCK